MRTLFLCCIMLSAAVANVSLTQEAILGSWSMNPVKPPPNALVTLVNDTITMTSDYRYTEIAHYSISYPSYGAAKIDLKYNLRVNTSGQYRLEGGIKKYQEKSESEIQNATDEAAAQTSLKEIEKLIKEESKSVFPVLSLTETEMDLQGAGGELKYTKPRKLPKSKLTSKLVPFFAPDGWRYPETTKDFSSYKVRLDSKDPNLLTLVEADFNGDGAQDAVAYLMNEGGQVALFMNLSQPDGSYSLEPFGSADRSAIIENGVFIAPAGEYTNTSNKQKFTTNHDGFMIVIFGAAATLNYFDSSSNSWKTAPIGKKF